MHRQIVMLPPPSLLGCGVVQVVTGKEPLTGQ
jgi:hypothetical protein